jgi:cytochrome c
VTRAAPLLVAAALLALPACDRTAERRAIQMTGGDPGRGRDAIRRVGCGSCHTIPGIPEADALVGPSLDRIARRVYIAGVLSNNPSNLARWLKDPPAVDGKTAMPNLHLSDDDIRDIACYLYTLE